VSVAPHVVAHRGWELTSATRRQWAVLLDLAVAVVICVLGYYFAAPWFRKYEAIGAVAVLRLIGVDDVSDVVPEQILMFRPDGEVLAGVVTTSCSALLTVVGLAALTSAVMRSRGLYAVLGLLVATAAVLVANNVRLVLSALAGLWWGSPAMTLFHDWVGTFWALAATLLGFLLMVYVALPTAHRAEQDVAGRHTARRPPTWARPGLGYRAAEAQEARGRQSTIVRFTHRYLIPGWVSRRLAVRREALRIDYRIGYLSIDERIETVRRLAADGLAAHSASLLAVATYDDDAEVIDALAEAIAARQWEPVTNDRVAGLRLWAHGWLLSRRLTRAEIGGQPTAMADWPTTPGLPVVPGAPDDETLVIRTALPRPPLPRRTQRSQPRPTPRSFARPTRTGSAPPSEDLP
jgi:exosortase/archaeosortase family protein